MKLYALIEKNREGRDIRRLCELLGVSRSGYYAWRNRDESLRTIYDHQLVEVIRELHQGFKRAYGARRVHRALRQKGFACSVRRVARLMKMAEIKASNCFEPLLYVLSLGIIPAHCKDKFLLKTHIGVGEDSKVVEQPFEVTTMQGWLMLLYPLLPSWQFGEIKDASNRAKNTVINHEAAKL